MKDFDFDELDKAVNSVLGRDTNNQHSQPIEPEQQSVQFEQPMQQSAPVSPQSNSADSVSQPEDAGTPDASSASSSPADPIQPINMPPTQPQPVINEPIIAEPLSFGLTTDQAVDSPAEPATNQESEPEPTAEPAQAPSVEPQPITTRPSIPSRRGRFMDMVHPSADMQTTSPVAATRRTGVDLNPVSSSSAPIANNDIISVEGTSLADSTPTLGNMNNHRTDDNSPTVSLEESNTDQNTNDDNEPLTEAVNTSDLLEPVTPVQPFIDGASATVEKRPLGSYVGVSVQSGDAAHTASETPEEPIVVGTSDQEVDASEAGETHDQINSDSVNFSQTSESISFTEETASETAQTSEKKSSEGSAEPSPDASTYNTTSNSSPSPFIAQQYKTAEEKADSEEHGVFDTNNYHQPLTASEAPVAGKRHIIFWIILIVALFVGGGALGALYFLSLN